MNQDTQIITNGVGFVFFIGVCLFIGFTNSRLKIIKNQSLKISKELKDLNTKMTNTAKLNSELLNSARAQVQLTRQLLKAYGHEPEA